MPFPGAMRRTVLTTCLVAAFAATAASARAGDTWSDPYPGLRVLERTTTNPSEHVHAAFVSLCTAGVSIDARSPQSTRITPSAWGQAMGARLAVNGDFFRTDRTTPTVYGDAVGVGIHWPAAQTGLASSFSGDWYYHHYGWIAFGPDRVELSHSGWVKSHAAELGVSEGWSPTAFTTDLPDGTFALVSGFPELVVEGKALTDFPDRSDTDVRNPRTAMGLSEDRRTFILVVVDGRTTASVGMTGAELAALMKDLGAHTAFNLDGGGSSAMWLAGAGVVNAPSDGVTRAVANEWGVFTDGMGQEPGSCIPAGGGDAGTGGGDAGTGGPDAGAGGAGDDPGAPGEMSGGCRAAPGAGSSGAPAAVVLLAGAFALRRRRRSRGIRA